MSKVEELLAKYNPNGVFQSDLREVSSIIRGKRVTKRDVKERGDYPVISGGESPMGYYDTFNREANTITIAQYGAAGYVDFQKNKFWANDVCYSILPFESVNNKYLYYTLKSKHNYFYSIRITDEVPFSLPINTLYSIQIPLPHIKVQEEIVKILDSFTNLIDALNEELSLRQKQFEYYREKLLTFEKCECEWKKLGDILDYEQPSKYIVSSSEYNDNYDIPVLTAGQTFILGYTDEKDGVYKASKKNPTIIFDDFTTGHHWVDFDFKIKSSAMKMLRLKNNKSILRYIFHSMALINYVPSEHSRQWISKYSQFEIPLPHIKVQEEIVNLLDTFTNLISSLKEEIALRQKQYEYYREKLLTFD